MKMKFEGSIPPPTDPADGEQEIQRSSLEAMNLIHAKNFDAAAEKIDSIQNEGRREQLKTILSLEKMRQKGKKEEVEVKEEKPVSDIEEIQQTAQPQEKEIVYAGEPKKQSIPRVTKKYIEDRRVRLEGDEWLSKEQKKEIGNMIDELEEVSAGLKEKKYSPEEAKEKRARKAHLMHRLQTGTEAGVTKEAIDAAREEGERGLESVTRGRLDEVLGRKEGEVAEDVTTEKKQEELAKTEDEKTKIYSDPNDDPIVRGVREKIEKDTTFHTYKLRVKASEETDRSKREALWHQIGQMERARGGVFWDEFVSTYPEKARAYADKIEGLRGVLTEASEKKEEFARVEDIFSPEDIQLLKEKLGFVSTKEESAPETVTQSHNVLTEGETKKHAQEARPMHEGREGEFNQRIVFATTFAELYAVLDDMGTVDGTHTATSEQVKSGIEEMRGQVLRIREDNTLSLENADEIFRSLVNMQTNQFTRRYGLRTKVQELLTEEYVLGSAGAIFETNTEEPEQEAEQILETVPEKEKPTWLRKIAGAGFGIQQAKNWAGEQAFGFAYKKFFEGAVDAKKQGKELKGFQKARFEAGLLVGSLARHYSEAKDVSEKNKEDFYAGKSKKMEWAKLAGEGIRAVRGVFAPMGMLRSPVWTLIALSRISETAKEHRFEKKKYDESSDEVAEDAIAMYEEAQRQAQAAGRDVPTADDISRVYAKGVIRGTLESGTGALTKTAAGLGVKKLIEPVFKEMQAVEEDATLSASEKQARLTVLARKNEKLIKEVDMLVDRAGSVDAVAYYLRQTGVWTKRISAAVAIETILEAGYHIFDALAEGADASHSANVEVSSLKRPHVASMAYTLGHMKDTEGLDLSGVEAPVPPVTIEHGGNIWSSAKDIAEKAGLSKEQFAAAWGESTVKLPDGRVVPIAELNLVHEGDTLSYVPGEGGGAGHFEFNNESHVAYGDTLNLPGAQEGEVISKMDFEQEPFMETVEVTAPEIATLPSGELPEAEGITGEVGTESPQEVSEKTSGTPVDRLAEMGIEKYSADVVDKELRWYFGQKYQTSEAWNQIQGMSARKFERMSPGAENAEIITKFHSYIEDLGKKTGIKPIGGLFRRDETVLEYFARVRRALIEQKSAGR